MIRDAVTLDAAMTVRDAQRRLATHGYWLDPTEGEARAWLEEYASRMRSAADKVTTRALAHAGDVDDGPAPGFADSARSMSAQAVAALLGRQIDEGRVAIRRQHGATILWYARVMGEVLVALSQSKPNKTVLEALNLHEPDASETRDVKTLKPGQRGTFSGVVLDGQNAVGVSEAFTSARPPQSRGVGGSQPMAAPVAGAPAAGGAADDDEGVLGIPRSPVSRGAAAAPMPAAPPRPVEISAFPRLDSPTTVVVGREFDVVIGLANAPSAGSTVSGRMTVSVPAGAASVTIEAHVVAEGFDVKGNAWKHPIVIPVADPTGVSVIVKLTAQKQREVLRTTTIVVHYLLDGVVCGSASRHIVVEATEGASKSESGLGTRWIGSEGPPPVMSLGTGATAPDIEVDISKPDGNTAQGTYYCVVRNSHNVPVTDAPLKIALGEEANTFAKSLIDQFRTVGTHRIVDRLLEGAGASIAEKLPVEFWDTLRAVAKKVTGRAITLQLNSAEPYVPWELALVEPPLDPARPKYLSAQVAMGRWLIGTSTVSSPPRDRIDVKAMAVMAGMYNAMDGLRPLPKAEEEAQSLAATYQAMPAVSLPCSLDDLDRLLEADVSSAAGKIGGVEAVHFAGHGEVNPTRPGDAALYMSNGQALTPLFFRKTKLGDNHRPFLFLNACMVGVGGELLGQFGGFPGACLQGQFSALVAPLWAVNDDIAKSMALDFYKAALVAKGTGKPVAEVLRDLRSGYDSSKPAPSYLAYVYYGNPNLKLANS